MKHTIDMKDVTITGHKIELAGSYGGSVGETISCKTLALEFNVNKTGDVKTKFVVLEKHKPILNTMSLKNAVKKYNELA